MGPLSMQTRAHHIRWSQVPTTLNFRLPQSYLWSKTSLNRRLIFSSLNKDLIHVSCLATSIIPTYSALVEERVTFLWHLDSHEIIPSVRKIQYPIMDLEVSVKTSFTLEVTLRKSRVENRWDLASLYVVCPCLHAGPIFQGWSEVGIKTCHKVWTSLLK